MMRLTASRRAFLESKLPLLIVTLRLQQWRVAQILQVSETWVQRACKRLGLKTQRTGPRSGPGHPNWKGGRMLDRDGYVSIWMPQHPDARKSGRILEHRLIMSRMLGRRLKDEEVVHHKDGNKQNNRPDNLELFGCNADHLAHELKGRVPNWTPKGLEAMRQAVRKPRNYNTDCDRLRHLAKNRQRDAAGRFVRAEKPLADQLEPAPGHASTTPLFENQSSNP